jgi:hypothetical protein
MAASVALDAVAQEIPLEIALSTPVFRAILDVCGDDLLFLQLRCAP